MALSNRERVDRALHTLADALDAYVEREMDANVGASWRKWVDHDLERRLERRPDGSIEWEIQPLLKVMFKNWQDVFKKTLGHAERSLISEMLEVRNRWAHQKPFTYDDTHRALDSAERLLQSISAVGQAREVNALRQEVLRTMFAEQRRATEKRSQATLRLESGAKAGLKPWREVITPHKDVSSGRYSEAEFAADLAQVLRGDAAPEYGDAAEFYRRTFLTEGLKTLLSGAIRRLSGQGGDPVVELQTNFGGGKTHSMLALYHLAGSEDPAALTGLDGLMAELGTSRLPSVNRAVLVGTALSPAEPARHGEVTARTLWGEMAWQLGGAEAYGMIEASDFNGTSPGSDALAALLKRTSPCLVLIDEWVAFARQLYTKSDMPAGSFDANLTFAQALTEAVKAVPGALLVASLPASQVEIGGEGGELALDRLKNTFGRLESSWRPATPEEGFEIVRRRLFEPMTERDDFAARDAVVKAYWDAYREGGAGFPPECAEPAYRKRLEAAYPIHPELFERLNNDWAALDKFQKTRGVLRLMAGVINVLWEQDDKGLLIMPGFVPLEDQRVEVELTRYLEYRWDAIIAADIGGTNASAAVVDRENPNLGRYSAARRVARTLFLASAPATGGSNVGITDRRVRLGVAQPGEAAGSFGDALRRLADRANYLYADGSRYWFSTQPSLTRQAEERAAGIEGDAIEDAIVERLQALRREARPFAGLHVVNTAGTDVGDEPDARLVVLGPSYPHARTGESAALAQAERVLKFKNGTAPRTCQNALLFLAPDRTHLVKLQDAVRKRLAWASIVDDAERLNLDPF